MSSLRIRPRFKTTVKGTTNDCVNEIKEAIDQNQEFIGLVSEQYCVIKICLEERHYWSPQLTLTFEVQAEGGLEIRGLYGPKPSVWAVFFMSYAALGVLSLFVGVFGLSQLMLEKEAPILWAIPIMAAIGIGLYLVAQAGQKVGAEQMFRIHHFYEQVIKHRVTLE
ncbi:hypothetical protein [Roseivirga sp.]|uniref:hypothetical protein n=1 Tax=Roseivirga sp. TaxID=1964215 RepID=UPI002B279CD9|nr:hypothetical protein [Roseivirga sp.]